MQSQSSSGPVSINLHHWLRQHVPWPDNPAPGEPVAQQLAAHQLQNLAQRLAKLGLWLGVPFNGLLLITMVMDVFVRHLYPVIALVNYGVVSEFGT